MTPDFYFDLLKVLVSTRNNWSDFIWPTTITITTIITSTQLARKEFSRKQKAEWNKIENERIEQRKFVLRLLHRSINQIIQDESRFRIVFTEEYNVEKGIRPQSILISFKELETLIAIDLFKWESIFKNHTSNLDELYLAYSAISIIWDSYNQISYEVSKINSFLNDYETPLIEKHQSITSFIEQKIVDYAKENKEDLTLNHDTTHEILTTLNEYNSEINNFHELYSILVRVEKLPLFDKIINPHFLEYNHKKNQFIIYYFKYLQEVGLFKTRINHLIQRITVNRERIQNFINPIKE